MAQDQTDIQVPCRQLLRVLIVEDSPADAELLVAALKRAGHPVQFDVADSAERFCERLEQGAYDIILADYNLRSWTALDALQGLHESGKDIPFVVITGSLGDEAAVECIKRGATDYLLKDRLHRLPLAIERALHDKAMRQQACQLQEAIRRGKKEWELTFDTVPDSVLLLDEQHRIKRANRAAAELLGAKPAELIGRFCYEAVHGSNEPGGNCPHALMLETDQQERCDVEEPCLGRVFDVTATPLRDSSGVLRGSVHVMRDVTERRRLEEQLRQSQKMEAIGQLAGGVAHDFNNLLMIVKGYTELLLDRLHSDDPLRRNAVEVLKAADRAAALVHQLLAFSRKQVLEPKVLDLNVVVAETKEMLDRLIGDNIELETVTDRELARVKVDPVQIEQVILNLAANARDAMPQGGKLRIETANVELDELDGSHAQMQADIAPGRYVLLAVRDTGDGMDAETVSHIFEPFFTTKERDKGTGLGLATVYGVVQQSGGHIRVESQPGQGTTFRIYLPWVDGGVEAAKPAKNLAEPPRGSESILLVEDAEGVREVAREFLKMSGYTVMEARDGDEALELVAQHDGPIHLLLSDVVMPGMSGRDLARRLTSLRPEIKVLYVSGYTDEAISNQGVLDPGTVFLQKPFSWETLARKVREVLDAETC